ncbi:RdgB/HAM1 family non-canonical purine NTP pyrophosphatase [Yanghanlia caeni]|uniref:dITP/XTP pyrophosphatase n=1 Tax=Yanghanlia caeni TaxID=3064283 RepID=A0ABU1D5H1_9BURK|nr:RdgB/HAM1 family non-canonical purine NTP pyrophosphatase [Alcaligenaceae bacterium LG-2]NGR06621.1 RdgB/HAM1 family non-canonical purine NTP pyrophosphatase [bacterium SGD-2]HZH55809.1 RdgB/HAM1 family non-canonical purine NTP pyrophosphatase [Burkholderiaceae bacterium]
MLDQTAGREVVLASNNAGKLREFSAILSGAGITMIAQGDLGVPEADEPYLTFLENALAKARHASQHSGRPALADDSGLCVPALGGAPGVYSARYASMGGGEKSDLANNMRLVSHLQRVDDHRAFYVAVLVYVERADDPCPIVAEGRWHGEIVQQPRGTNGFGYDPHFWLPDRGCTVAELDPAEKNRISHRARALQTLLQRLREQGQ